MSDELHSTKYKSENHPDEYLRELLIKKTVDDISKQDVYNDSAQLQGYFSGPSTSPSTNDIANSQGLDYLRFGKRGRSDQDLATLSSLIIKTSTPAL